MKFTVLKDGYCKTDEGEGVQSTRACGTITLVKGPKNIIVDTGNPWDRDIIIEGLKKHGIKCDDINYVVCTHGHSDHVGNLNLFTKAIHIVSYDICYGDQYILHSFEQGIPYEIDDDVEVLPTPGHTGADVTVVVRNTKVGTVAITGDLFECEDDLEDSSIWQKSSENEELQEKSRINMLQLADVIIPGHGKLFEVPIEYKSSMCVVMFYEERTETSAHGQLSTTSSEYLIVEHDWDKLAFQVYALAIQLSFTLYIWLHIFYFSFDFWLLRHLAIVIEISDANQLAFEVQVIASMWLLQTAVRLAMDS